MYILFSATVTKNAFIGKECALCKKKNKNVVYIEGASTWLELETLGNFDSK